MSSGEASAPPFVSIIIPAKNQERTIEECLRSLNELDYPKDRVEAVLVDGHSTDRTVEIACHEERVGE